MRPGQHTRHRAWLLALAVSAVVHAGLLGALARRQAQDGPASPLIVVTQIRPEAQPESAPTSRPSKLERPAFQERALSRPELLRGAGALNRSPPAAARGGPSAASADPTGPPPLRSRRRAARERAEEGAQQLRSFLRSADCDLGSLRLSPGERERCLDRLRDARQGEAVLPPRRWTERPPVDEGAVISGTRNALKSVVLRPGRPDSLTGEAPVMVGVALPFGRPPPALPNIPASTLRGDDDALRPRPKPPEGG